MQPDQLALWPSAWRDLLKEWFRQGRARKKWAKRLLVAGGDRVQDAADDGCKGIILVSHKRENSTLFFSPWKSRFYYID